MKMSIPRPIGYLAVLCLLMTCDAGSLAVGICQDHEKIWRYLKKYVYPNLGIKAPVVSKASSTNFIHVLLFNDYDHAYRCEFYQTSNELFSVSSVWKCYGDRGATKDRSTMLSCETNSLTTAVTIFDQFKALESFPPVGLPWSVGHPDRLCVIASVATNFYCFYYDTPSEDQEERQITTLCIFADESFKLGTFDCTSRRNITQKLNLTPSRKRLPDD
jgi:hypothetical protein